MKYILISIIAIFIIITLIALLFMSGILIKLNIETEKEFWNKERNKK